MGIRSELKPYPSAVLGTTEVTVLDRFSVVATPDGRRVYVSGFRVVDPPYVEWATLAYDGVTGALLWEARYPGGGRFAAEPKDMVLLTLRAMALGGMRDHIGGGLMVGEKAGLAPTQEVLRVALPGDLADDRVGRLAAGGLDRAL